MEVRDSTKALYEFYPEENKNDFYHAYVYLKYIEHLLYHAIQSSGFPSKEPAEKLDESLEEMLKATVQHIGDMAPDAATSIYHGKVVNLKDAIKLVTQREDLSLLVPEKVVPFKVARDIILKNPQSIAVGVCACRATQENPCLPMEVCLFVGDPFASFIADQNPKFRKIPQEEAVSILEDEHKRNHVHCAYFKKDLGSRFFAICNCCSCCCLGVRMWNLLEGQMPILAPSGYLAQVGDDCNGCGDCVDTCQFKAISLDEEGERAVIDSAKCMGCGVCEDVCPVGAISLRREPSKGEPLDIEELVTKMA